MEFIAVYLREAHPADGWSSGKDKVAGKILQPKSLNERQAVASKCCAALNVTIPMVVDDMDDSVGHAYSGMPDRLYIIDSSGKIAYQGGRGPFCYLPSEMEQSLIMLLMDESRAPKAAAPVVPATKTSQRLPVLTNEEAWKRLPGAPETELPLPMWARMLAGPIPLTTARMLELDALHRTGNHLDPKLRAVVRWAAADANRCDYAKAVAAADFRRAGVSQAELEAFIKDTSRLPAAERAAVTFARKMMREAHAVTDEEVKQLVKFFGEERVVALVALLAHASFQDRILLAANVQVERGEPLPPLTVQFAKPKPKPPVQGSGPTAKAESKVTNSKAAEVGSEWFGLQASLDKQRTRAGRIRVPSREEVLKRIGEKHPAAWQLDILWSRVCYGSQPELTDAWFACAAAFRQEAKLDRVFEQGVFWVVTRSLQCFY